MDGKTQQALIGRGFSTELIKKVGNNKHTVSLLKAMSQTAMGAFYTEDEIQQIVERIKRNPIPIETVDVVISKSGGACCYCGDGNSSRPFQMHHIEPHSDTQDDAEDNLMLVCPTHHDLVPKHDSPKQQKSKRDLWYSLIELAKDYQRKGIPFPFDRLAGIDFHQPYKPADIIHNYFVAPPLAVQLSRHALAEKCIQRLEEEHFVVIVGSSGSGKTTLAFGAAGISSARQSTGNAFLFRGSIDSISRNLPLIMQHLSCAKRRHVLILDDANTFLSVQDLEMIAQAARTSNVRVVATWTNLLGDGSIIERRFPQWTLVTWELLQNPVVKFLLDNEASIAEAIQSYRTQEDLYQIGIGSHHTPLRIHLSRMNRNIKTAAEFFFLLRGGKDTVSQDVSLLAHNDRSDIPVVYAAIEQIADFERAVSVEEILKPCAEIVAGCSDGFTSDWVKEVFEHQCRLGRMQRRRGSYTTIHREYAKRLISGAMSDSMCSESTKLLLNRDFDCTSINPLRWGILVSWFYYDDILGPWVREWAEGRTANEWEQFIDQVSDSELAVIGTALDSLRTLSMGERIDRGVIATRISDNACKLKNAIAAANEENWRDLRTLAGAMGTEEQPNDVVSGALSAVTCASVLSSTLPDHYDEACWFFAAMKNIAKDWVRQVGKHLKWEQIFPKFNEVHKGDLKVFFHFRSLMRCLDVPVQRSTLRRISTGLYHALEGAKVSELSLGFGEDTKYLLLFPQDYTYILSAIDPIVWARELECSEPRDWRKLSPLLPMDVEAKVLQKIHDEIDSVRLVENIKAKYIGHEYDMRCFLWFLRLGSKLQREWYLTELDEAIRDAFSRVERERRFLWIVVRQFDSKVADTLATEFGFSPSAQDQKSSEREEWFPVDKELARIRQEFLALDNEGTDYLVMMDELCSENAKGRYWMPVS